MIDPRTPCIIGVGRKTWHPDEVDENGAPEPLKMWELVSRAAGDDSGVPKILESLDSIDVVYSQTWQYDDAPGRLSELLKTKPSRSEYSGIGGTTPQVLTQNAATRILAGKSDAALIVGAEALATKRAFKKRGESPTYSFPPANKTPFPWEAPFDDSELAHEVTPAWLTFALFDSARRASRGVALDEYREELGRMFAPMTKIAAANPDAWYRIARTVNEIVEPQPDNRMVGYPYTKYMVSVMDVDMAAAVIMTSHERADSLGIPRDRRVYLRGWCYATDPIYVAEHPDLSASPAMAAASKEAQRLAGVGTDEIAHLDLYSCFGSSLNFARDTLGIGLADTRPLTVTGGLPYHGGAGSDYMTHSIATMADTLRNDPGSYGMVTGVGMHMTKHVFGIYSTTPGTLAPPNQKDIQSQLDKKPTNKIVESHNGLATIATYCVVHGRDGEPQHAVLVCDVEEGQRAYAILSDIEACRMGENTELIGRSVQLTPTAIDLPTSKSATRHYAELVN